MKLRPEIALARTTARSASYDPRIGGASTAGLSFTAADCGHLLKGVPPLGTHLVLAKYGDGQRIDKRMAVFWLGIALVEAGVRFPRSRPVVRSGRIVAGAVEEFIAAPLCGNCEGRGLVAVDDLVVDCAPCEGTGRQPWSRRRRAEACGLTEGALRNTGWKDVHREALRHAVLAEESALRTMSRNQREEVIEVGKKKGGKPKPC